ncbi:MarR family winged helix-turn-helix transcriptional regulator [Nocardioides sp. zg-DK7169]|uniref:MarR family winged helix-turn-helix transcriptional regulator n=1 Tax=Nocardioides sp. zg-DK7169 TaxID=2736600 RepID=UPI0015560027|nr:MarR family transcriptional regulator [Nocardioides sp. zg-DK7169]NPC95862.1 MarR family transcriptional regulator [Nocardioides sp. zg-DK7169]
MREQSYLTGPIPALRDLMALSGRVRHHLARRAGLSETELLALDHLSTGVRGPAELARLLEVSTPAATGIVDRLVGRGHAVRRAHVGDRRRTEVHMTQSGRVEVRGQLEPMLGKMRELDAEFSPEELAVVERYLRGAQRALETLLDDPPSAAR